MSRRQEGRDIEHGARALGQESRGYAGGKRQGRVSRWQGAWESKQWGCEREEEADCRLDCAGGFR